MIDIAKDLNERIRDSNVPFFFSFLFSLSFSLSLSLPFSYFLFPKKRFSWKL